MSSVTAVPIVGDVHAVLLGVATPLSDVAIGSSETSVLAIVSTQHGTLSADAASSATVHGGGSNVLRISGTPAAVNATLATLNYFGTAVGADAVTITLLDALGRLFTPIQLPLTVLPLAGNAASSPAVAIDQGTLMLDTRVVNGPAIALTQPFGSQTATASILINSTIGEYSSLSVRNDNPGGVPPRVAIAGRVEIDGTTAFAGAATTITLAQGATLLNEGAMTIGANSAQFLGAGQLVNDGTITVMGDGETGSPVRIDTAIFGTGQILLANGAALSLKAAVGGSETILLGTGVNTLHLAAPATFAGAIDGFSRLDTLVLDGVMATSGIYSAAADAETGTLTLLNGQSVVARLHFSAPESGATFQLGRDDTGAVTVRLTPAASSSSTSLDVYRFFDAVRGTQLLTGDPAERDAILNARPDLRYEGVGFQAVAPANADANAAAVYRFFDTNNGTHLLTASATERDMLMSRPDLIFEPASTMIEHATAEAGDAAVYRFFDQSSGAHFFTADAGERATILSTRPDMTAEGIAFYAPHG